MATESNKPGVIVVGGGVAGIQASLDLAEMGHQVYLVEASTSIGGNMAKLDKTFPTNDCAMCMISPKLVECARHPNIDIRTMTEIVDLKGEAGNFDAVLRTRPRYIDPAKCVGCGICAQKCPKKIVDTYNEGLSQRKAAYIEYPQAIPLIYAIDPNECIYLQKGKCRACEKFCEQKAINFDQQPVEETIRAGSIVLALGYKLYDPLKVGEYGYGRYPNVVTSLEFERMLSASGPSQGHVVRPSDDKAPKRIAWIQCVGSRDVSRDRGFCSSVCCMYAVKQAMVMKEHDKELQPTFFFMDLRAQGRGFDAFCQRAVDEAGLRMMRSMISQVSVDPQTNNLVIEYLEPGSKQRTEEEFDLVVLSVGMDVRPEARQLMKLLNVETNEFGFCEHPFGEAVATSREGIYACGALQGPKDIPETVAQASAAAAGAIKYLETPKQTETRSAEVKPVAVSTDKEPRIGVFVCHCGINIASIVDVDKVAEEALKLPHVVHTEHLLFTCSTDSMKRIQEAIKEKHLNRVVVSACSPRTHEKLFQSTLKEAGLNPYFFEQANIRDQCSWVHQKLPAQATEKAMSLVSRAVARAAQLEPLEEHYVKVQNQALVVGGGVAGMSAALTFAEQGIPTTIVEKTDKLGGFALNLPRTLQGGSPRALALKLETQVKGHPLVDVLTNADLVNLKGSVANFTGVIEHAGETKELNFGAAVIASGGIEYRPTEYLYGENDAVITQVELSKKLEEDPGFASSLSTVAMIQCIGSRNDDNPLCSRVCCSAAVRNALAVKERNPNAQVLILYRDVRTFGLMESYYTKAREQNVLFARFEADSPPQLKQVDGGLELSFLDITSGRNVRFRPQVLALSAGIRPEPSAKKLSQVLKLPQTAEGHFLEAHVKLRPLDFSTSGLFLAGVAHSPQFTEEAITQGRGAAIRALSVLTKSELLTSSIVAEVNPDLCAACLTCVRACPFGVPRVTKDRVAEIDIAACHGCGVCVSECPGKAITLHHYTDKQLMSNVVGCA
ncbi:MAG: CoB--CoM heterodisulfide reductase iron-sulfur subunit A family protein [Deltaproteobacteria bacterium]|nr:CoB--CoM heterodisulfide reductase iron-sulfur subunit A family protein [Deltaproteobacteria bacterium]